MNASVLDGEPFAGAGDSALYFVGDQQNAVLVADAAQFLHENGGRYHVSAFALNRLNEHGGHFFRRQNRLEQLVFQVGSAAQGELLGIHAFRRSAINIGVLRCV